MKEKILWVDDEIENLRSLVYLLNEEGYEVIVVSNGEDAISLLEKEKFNIVFLDQYMHGLDGLETLGIIREMSYTLPIVMITKSEDDSIIDMALSKRIDDYLIKPVVPKQLIATLKRVLNKTQKIKKMLGENYSKSIRKINTILSNEVNYETYHKVHHILNLWNLNINRNIETEIIQMHEMQKEQTNAQFAQYIEQNYKDWIKGINPPIMSHTFIDNFIVPQLKNNEKIFFLLIDCMRYDHYLLIETYLQEYFRTSLKYYYSILPTATPYSRNAIFSGMLPNDIHKSYPEKWKFADNDSQNQYEEFFVKRKMQISMDMKDINYHKISTNEFLKQYIAKYNTLMNNRFNILVINIMDIFTHFRSESKILKDLLPDENSLLAFVSTWFRTSGLLDFFRILTENGYKIIISSDHGSIISKKPLMMATGKDVSINLKYKFGSSIKTSAKGLLFIDSPADYGLPIPKQTDRWYIAKGNGYIVYSTKYNEYKKEYFNTFQHGGLSMEEMIMPVGIIEKDV